MATSDILGLFMSPEQYQAQQMAQQQANEQARAINFANLDPRGQANYGVFLGAQQLGRGFAGLLGVQDPQLQRIRQRQEIMQTINPADPESLMAGIQRASQRGDQELALTLADYARKARGDLALAEQREREKVPEAIQIAEEIRKLTVKRDALPEGAERNSIDAQIKRLQLAQKATGSTDTEAYKNAFQLTVAQNPTLDTESQEFQGFLATNLQSLLLKDKPESKTEAQRNAYDITLARYPNLSTDSPEFKTEYGKILDSLVSKKDGEKRSPEAQLLIDADYIPGSPAYISAMDKMIAGKQPGGRQIEKLVINSEIVRLKELQAGLKKDSPEYKSYQEQIEFLGGGAGKNKVSAFGQLLIDKGIDPGSKEWNDKMDAYITKELAGKDEKEVSYGVDREATARAEYGKRFDDLDQNEQKAVNKIVDAERRINAPKVEVKNVLPKEPVDIAKTEKAIRDTVEPQLRTVTTVDSALATLKLAKEQNNPAAFNAARVQLAKSLGDSTLSATDIRNAGGDPSLLGTIRDTTSTVVFGTPGNPTLDAVEKTLLAIRKVARKQATNTLDRQKRLARSATFNDGTKVYTDQQIKDLFEFPDLNPDTAAGVGDKKAVPWNQLKK